MRETQGNECLQRPENGVYWQSLGRRDGELFIGLEFILAMMKRFGHICI